MGHKPPVSAHRTGNNDEVPYHKWPGQIRRAYEEGREMTGETGLQKRGKFWHVRVSVNGKKIWRTTGKTDKKEAIKEARDIRRDLRNTPSGSRRQIRSDPERLDATLEEVIEMADAHAGTHGTFKTRGNSEGDVPFLVKTRGGNLIFVSVIG